MITWEVRSSAATRTPGITLVIPQGIGRSRGLSLRTWVELHHEPALCPDSLREDEDEEESRPNQGDSVNELRDL